MNVWIVTRNGTPVGQVYTSLREACRTAGVNYLSAIKGKRYWMDRKSGDTAVLTQAELIKIKRGSGGFKKK